MNSKTHLSILDSKVYVLVYQSQPVIYRLLHCLGESEVINNETAKAVQQIKDKWNREKA